MTVLSTTQLLDTRSDVTTMRIAVNHMVGYLNNLNAEQPGLVNDNAIHFLKQSGFRLGELDTNLTNMLVDPTREEPEDETLCACASCAGLDHPIEAIDLGAKKPGPGLTKEEAVARALSTLRAVLDLSDSQDLFIS
jgi:hypothetical protein